MYTFRHRHFPSVYGTARPDELLIKAAELTRTGIGLPAYYNDEVIIPALHEPRTFPWQDARELQHHRMRGAPEGRQD